MRFVGSIVVCLVACKGSAKEQSTAKVVEADAAPPLPPVAKPGERTIGARVAAGSVREDFLVDAYAVLIPADRDAKKAKRAIDAVVAERKLDAEVSEVPITEEVFVPDLLDYFGHDISPEDAAALSKAKVAVTVMAGGPTDAAEELLHGTAAAARAGAAAVGGWIQDLPTAETFTPASFDEQRPAKFALDVNRLIVIHAVGADDSTVMFETFGLQRFGLPELYMDGIPQAYAEDTYQLVNAAAQTLVDTGRIERDGVLTIDAPEGTVAFSAVWSHGDDVGPDASTEIELGLPDGIAAAITAAFGERPDEPFHTDSDDPELRAASERAKQELAALAPHFANGIPEGEHLIVKAPFTTDDGGIEWMWVEVSSWAGARITGVLLNKPAMVAGLHEGARVEVAQADVFDYHHTLADGTEHGGETNRIMEQRLR